MTEKMNLNHLVHYVKDWFQKNGLATADPRNQMLKLYEEAGELSSALAKNKTHEIPDAIGDITVVLIGLCTQLNLDFRDCLEVAYNEIKDRKITVVNGIGIKENDL